MHQACSTGDKSLQFIYGQQLERGSVHRLEIYCFTLILLESMYHHITYSKVPIKLEPSVSMKSGC